METKSQSSHEVQRIAVYLALLLTIALLAWITIHSGLNSIYVELFLFPVILVGFWDRKKAIYLALAYGLTGIIVTWSINGYTQLPELFQAAMYILVAALITVISERKERSLDQVRESETRHRLLATESQQSRLAAEKSLDECTALLENVPGLIWRSDCSGRIVYVNRNWLGFTGRSPAFTGRSPAFTGRSPAFTGRTPGEMSENGWLDDLHEADRSRREQAFQGAQKSGGGYECVFRLRRKDGAYRWIMEICRPFADPAGNPSGYISYACDITDRRLSTEELGVRNDELISLCAISTALAQPGNTEETMAYILKETAALIGGCAGAVFLEDDTLPGTLRRAAQTAQGNPGIRFRESFAYTRECVQENVTIASAKDHACIEQCEDHGKVAVVPLKSKACNFGMMAFYYHGDRDFRLWNQKKAIQLTSIASQASVVIECIRQYYRLLEANRHLADIIEESPDAMLTTDAACNIITFNGSACRLLKHTRDEVCGKHISTILPPGSSIKIHTDRSHVREFRAGDDSIVKLNISAARLRGSETAEDGYVITLKDLTAIAGLKIVPVSKKTEDQDQEYRFKKGSIYYVNKQKTDYYMDIFAHQVRQGMPGLCISRQNPRLIRDRHGLDKTPLIWLSNSENPQERTVKPEQINSLVTTMTEFIDSAGDGAIMLDGMEYFIASNGFEVMLKFVQHLNDKIMLSNTYAMFCIDTSALDMRQLHLLLSEMTEFTEE